MDLHYILQHLLHCNVFNTFARILFVDFSSTFNTIIPVPDSDLCAHPNLSVDDQLPDRQAADSELTSSLIQDRDESAYRQEVKELAVWCNHNNLELNMLKTVEMIVDFSRNPPALPPLTIIKSTLTTVDSFKFLGTTISQDLKWDNNIGSIAKKTKKRLYFLRQLRKFNLPHELLKQFYLAIIESVLCTYITVWIGSEMKTCIQFFLQPVPYSKSIQANDDTGESKLLALSVTTIITDAPPANLWSALDRTIITDAPPANLWSALDRVEICLIPSNSLLLDGVLFNWRPQGAAVDGSTIS
ncbi:gastrula zinc finger protein XlCGF28.1-like [Silurus meridionalis]|nr:gastrula zinc finger protein XlCGF28.1-like [Silurus meridionalis]